MYEYKADVYKVIDGDTVDLYIHLGFDITIKKRVRLLGIDTPEVRTRDLEEKKKGIAAKDRLIELIGTKCIVRTQLDKAGKYGRILGIILGSYEFDADNNLMSCININEKLIEEGHAVPYG